MPIRAYPQDYLNESQVYIPKWVPIIIGIALIGSFAIAIYAISKVK